MFSVYVYFAVCLIISEICIFFNVPVYWLFVVHGTLFIAL
jgi:hypothetical protein